MNRRRFLGLGASAIGATGVVATGGRAGPGVPGAEAASALPGSTVSSDRAYEFLDFMLDAYQQDSVLRLIQSYSDRAGLGSTAFVYDNALAIVAYLARGTRADLARARLLGDSLLYAQEHDPTYSDGRVRQAYWVGPFTLPYASSDEYFIRRDGTVNLVGAPFFFLGSAVGDVAWAAIALAHLFARTRWRSYLDGAVRLGHWIVDNAYDTVGLGGYSFGVDASNQRISTIKSSEHNIDVYALFTNLLAPLTRDPGWLSLGQHALEFIDRMWNPEAGFLYVGSNDGTTINKAAVAEDVQAWSVLAVGDAYARGLDWAKTNLATTDTPQSLHASLTGNLRLGGVTFSSGSRHATDPGAPSDPLPDPDAVWFEGTAHMAAALFARRLPRSRDLPTFGGDVDTAQLYLSGIQLAQAELGRGQVANAAAIPDGTGVVAASGVLNTGFGFSYFPNLHIGATSWYLVAAFRGNPYRI